MRRRVQTRPISDYRRDGTTYSRESVSDTRRRTRFEIGDSLQPSLFYPQFKSLHWDNECNCSVRLFDADYSTGVLSVRPDVIEWRNGQRIARFYEHNPYAAEDGGFEFEVVLLSRPLTPRITFTLQSKEFDFFHQPALTTDEIARGDIRPEHAVNSYAVYHKARSNNRIGGKHYRAGKAFHLFRSKSTDANGRSVWNTLTVDPIGGFVHIDIPLDFFATAVYPVTIDPTFGYTTIGASTSAAAAPFGTKFTPSEAGTVTTMHSYAKAAGADVALAHGIYSDVAGVPTSKLAEDSGNVTISGTTPAWYVTNVSYTFTAVALWLASWTQTTSGTIYYDTGGGANQENLENSGPTFETWPATWTPGGYNAVIISIYATYTAAGGCPKSLLTLGVGCEEQNIILPSRTIFLPIIGLEWLRRRKNQASGSLSRRKS